MLTKKRNMIYCKWTYNAWHEDTKIHVRSERMTAAKKMTIGKKMQRSVLTVLLVLILLFSSANIPAVAAETAAWKVNTSGVISEYTGQDTDLCVPSVVGGQAVTSVDMLSAGRKGYAPDGNTEAELILNILRIAISLPLAVTGEKPLL